MTTINVHDPVNFHKMADWILSHDLYSPNLHSMKINTLPDVCTYHSGLFPGMYGIGCHQDI